MTEHEGRMRWRGHDTWYRVVAELDPASPQVPVVICHGGPGAAHDYCEPIADLSRFGRACVLYDQLGCGRSELLPDAPAEFWTPQLFKEELTSSPATSASPTETRSSGSRGAGCSRWSTPSTIRPDCVGSSSPTRRRA